MNIPASWQLAKLSEVIVGLQPGFAQRPNEKAVGTPQLRTNHITPDGDIDLSDLAYVNASTGDLVKYGVKRGDVVFNNTNSIEWVGKTAFFYHDGEYVLSNHMTRIRVDEQVLDAEFLAKYLHYLWRNGVSRRWAKHWVNQAAIDQSGLSNFQVLLPPLSEQRHIISILREVENIRRLRHEVNEKAKSLLPSIFEKMFGQEIAEKKKFGIRKVSELGEVQYGLTVNSNRRSSISQYPYLRVANVYRGGLNLSEVSNIGVIGGDAGKFLLSHGDVLVVEGHADPKQIGRAAVWNSEIPNCLHQNHLLRIRPKSDLISSNYLASCINSPSGLSYMLRFAKTSSGLNTINSKVLSDMPIVCPPLAIQQEFEQIYSNYRKQLVEFAESKAKTEELFRALSVNAFNGGLTMLWREQHEFELGKPIIGFKMAPTELRRGKEFLPSSREDTHKALSDKQRRILALAETLDGYFTVEKLNGQINLEEQLALPDLHQTLQLLAKIGLLVCVRVAMNPTGETVLFSRAYRRLRTTPYELSDASLLVDRERLEAAER